jgi:hypothetical protein
VGRPAYEVSFKVAKLSLSVGCAIFSTTFCASVNTNAYVYVVGWLVTNNQGDQMGL